MSTDAGIDTTHEDSPGATIKNGSEAFAEHVTNVMLSGQMAWIGDDDIDDLRALGAMLYDSTKNHDSVKRLLAQALIDLVFDPLNEWAKVQAGE